MASIRSFLRYSGGVSRPIDPLMQCLAPRLSRSITTEVQMPQEGMIEALIEENAAATTTTYVPLAQQPKIPATVYHFPTMEPLRYTEFAVNHLRLPLRKDILHRAIVYEGDATRSGTASSKWRSEVRGSGRKVLPQKGTGRARAGDKKSPIRVGGGVAHGPHPRDFSTGLPKKVYDLAWRMAFSYRFRRGEIIIVDNITIPEGTGPRLFKNIFESNGWGNANGRSLLVLSAARRLSRQQKEAVMALPKEERAPALHSMKEEEVRRMVTAMEDCGDDARLIQQKDVDVKNLLEMGRIVIEHRALAHLLNGHSSDL